MATHTADHIDLTAGFVPKAQHETDVFPQATAANLPAPLRRIVDSTGMRVVQGRPTTDPRGEDAVASVSDSDPSTIVVNNPKRFREAMPQTIAHEATHTALDNLSPGVKQIAPYNAKDPYDYGGTGRLVKLRSQGVKLYNLPQEEAATIMQYYAAKGGQKAPPLIQKVYGPWARDFDTMPLSSLEPTRPDKQHPQTVGAELLDRAEGLIHPETINTEPRPPLPPPQAYHETQVFPQENPEETGSVPNVSRGTNGETRSVSHPAGDVTGYDEETGLPIVRRRPPSNQGAKQEAPAENAPGTPVGSTEPESGRKVIQPTGDPKQAQKLATAAMPAYRAGLKDAIQNIPGAELVATRAKKDPKRLDEKIEEEGQPVETVTDYGAAQIAVDSPQARDAVVKAVKARFPVIDEKDNFDQGDKEYGYRQHSLQVQMPNGSSQELQIVPREVQQANAGEHEDYKEAREAKIDGDPGEAKEATDEARAHNDAAMAKFEERNSEQPALSKGSAVTLRDGQRGTIQYLDPNMKIARVRTAAGKSLTVRQSQLTPTPEREIPSGHVLVSEHLRKLPQKQ